MPRKYLSISPHVGIYAGQPLFTLAIIFVMGGACFLTDRWEIKKCYLPQKQSLELLRATLAAEG